MLDLYVLLSIFSKQPRVPRHVSVAGCIHQAEELIRVLDRKVGTTCHDVFVHKRICSKAAR